MERRESNGLSTKKALVADRGANATDIFSHEIPVARSVLLKAPSPGEVSDAETQALELVQNWLILEPETPAADLAQRIIAEAEPGVILPLSVALLTDYFVRLVKTERAKQRPARAKQEPLFAEWADLPTRILTPDGRVSLKNANLTQLRAHLKHVKELHEKRLAEMRLHRQIEQLEALLELMQGHARRRGITVSEVAELAS